MAFSFLQPDTLKDFVKESDEYMRPFFEPIAELERLGRGKPGRIPKGKPRVTDGTLAGIRRETPKRIVQQLPTGKVSVKAFPDYEDQISAVLTDEILPNANSGGTPFSKSKKGIKDVLTSGASAAYCFYNRRGEKFFADFRRIYIKDLGFEKGKVSEFDSNVMKFKGYYTPMDIKAIMYWQQQLERKAKDRKEKFSGGWDLKVLQALLDQGVSEKDDQNKSDEEKAKTNGSNGYFTLEHIFQIGTGAEFYAYAPGIDKVAKTTTSNDPRGIIPIHLLVPEEDDSNPLGEALLSISAGKQNLLDFDMQMYQYSEGLQYSPPVKKWGNVPTSAIRLVPDAVIDMGASNKTQSDFETVDIVNSAQRNFAANYGLIKSQIINEQGSTTDTSISGTVGNPGFSKTDAGVNALQNRLGISDNDLRKSYEGWFGRICETMLNIHFAETQGKKELDLQKETMKRLKMDKAPTLDFSKDFGKIAFTVDASTSQAQDAKQENQDLISLFEITSKTGGLRPDKQMTLINQIIKNSGVDDPEKLMYTDDEIAVALQASQQPQGDPNAQAQADQVQQQLTQKVQELQQKLQEEMQVPYKDSPESIKRQKEERAGYAPATDISPTQSAIDTKNGELSLKAHQASISGVQAAHNIQQSAVTSMSQNPDISASEPAQQDSQPEETSEQGLPPEEEQFVMELHQRSFSPDQIATAVTMLRHNYADEDILSVLQQPEGAVA